MTSLLNQAFQKAASLPDSIQDALAEELLEEIEWEKQWNKTLDNSSDKLRIVAEKALKEYRSGKTDEQGMDEL